MFDFIDMVFYCDLILFSVNTFEFCDLVLVAISCTLLWSLSVETMTLVWCPFYKSDVMFVWFYKCGFYCLMQTSVICNVYCASIKVFEGVICVLLGMK